MTPAVEHYERLLAEHYTWMLGGDIEAAVSGQAALLRAAGLPAGTAEGGADLAVDLGCGPGPQSLAPARLGCTPVIAVDTSDRLLDELTTHAVDAGPAGAIRPVRRDIRQALPEVVDAATATVGVGNTLPPPPRQGGGLPTPTTTPCRSTTCCACGARTVAGNRAPAATPSCGSARPGRRTTPGVRDEDPEVADADAQGVHGGQDRGAVLGHAPHQGPGGCGAGDSCVAVRCRPG
ncbi:class I SAM-dependent methyltransferase [Streptomyces puniciscabiei]